MRASALLVLAYTGASTLRHAIPIYIEAGFDVYIHLDSKADLEQYRRNLGDTADLCTFIEPRRKIYWGGFSMLLAEFDLIRYAKRSGVAYESYTLVSDDTLPLWPAAKLHNLLEGNSFDRISLRAIRDDDPFFLRYDNFYHFDHNATSLLGRPIEASWIDDALIKTISEIVELRKLGKKKVELFYGSQWWSLRASTAYFVLDTFDNDYLLRKSFEFSAVPDEMCIQTIVGSRLPAQEIREGPIYVDWSRNPRPYIFTSLSEVKEDIKKRFPFIRKVAVSSESLACETESLLANDPI